MVEDKEVLVIRRDVISSCALTTGFSSFAGDDLPYLERPGKHISDLVPTRFQSESIHRLRSALLRDKRYPLLNNYNGFQAMLLPETGLIATPPTKEPLAEDLESMKAAIQQARLGLEEGGIPIGGALVNEFRPKFIRSLSLTFDCVLLVHR